MKKLLLIPLMLLCFATLAQNNESQIKTFIDAIRTGPVSQAEIANAMDQLNYNKQGLVQAFTASGTNAYSVTVGAGVTALSNGVILPITFTNANSSTTVTLNVNNIGAVAIKDNEGNDPGVGDIKAGSTLFLKHNGTNFRIVGAASGGGGGGGSFLPLTLTSNATVDGDFDLTFAPYGHIIALDALTGLTIDLDDDYGIVIDAEGGVQISTEADFQILSVNSNDTDGDLTIIAEKTSTNTSAQIGRFVRTTSGTAANNIAGYISLGVENATGVQRDAQVVHQLVDATNGSEDSNIKLRGYVAGVLTDLLTVQGSTLLINGNPVSGTITSSSFVFNEVPTGSINSSNTAFTIANTPTAGTVQVYLNGLRMQVTTDYTISGTTITFVTAPTTGDLLICDYMK